MILAYLLEKIDISTLSLGNLTEEEADNKEWSGDFPPLLVGAMQAALSWLLTSCCGH